jgi:hypothetical protein
VRVLLFGAILTTACAGAAGSAPAPTATAVASMPAGWEAKVAAHLDERAAAWLASPPQVGENFACAMSCHTTQPYLIARGTLGVPGAIAGDVRARIEARVAASATSTVSYYGAPGSRKERESRGTEAILDAATLALSGEHDDVVEAAFAQLWKQQRADGGWDWLDFGLEPWESRGDWGAALAAIAVGSQPAAMRDATHTAALVAFLRGRAADTHDPVALHDRIELLRAGAALPEVLTDEQREAIAAEIIAAQRADGGWSLASWGRGKRADASAPSDAYATAYALLGLCESGRAGHDVARRGVAWLVAAYRSDGSWPARSVNEDAPLNDQFMSDAATAYAVLALRACSAR